MRFDLQEQATGAGTSCAHRSGQKAVRSWASESSYLEEKRVAPCAGMVRSLAERTLVPQERGKGGNHDVQKVPLALVGPCCGGELQEAETCRGWQRTSVVAVRRT